MHLTSGIDWSCASYEALLRDYRWRIPERLNIAVAACDWHADGRGRVALYAIDEDGHTTSHSFDELKVSSDLVAGLLADGGVDRGDRVAVLLPQRLETALAHLATMKLGAISVPLSPLFRTDALGYRLTHSGAKILVTDQEHRAYVPPVPGLTILTCEELPSLLAGSKPHTAVDTSRDDPAMLIYTSGTSGMPKGALHAHRFLPGRLSGFELVHRLESLAAGDRPFWTPADWAWVGGLVDCVLTPWVFGCPVLASRGRCFSSEAVFDLLVSANVRSTFLPPTAIRKLRAIERAAEPRTIDLVSVHTAGEPLGPDDYRWATRTFGKVFELYGMTEIGATIGNCSMFDVRPGSMGKPLPGHSVAILDDRGDPVAAGEIGEIAIRRDDPGMFLEYHRDPDGTAARFRGDYLVSGDLARMDGDGYVHYEGRADDMFNTSGYRVGPTEIERTLGTHPAVELAAVVGDPDQERGHVVKAFVLLKAGCSPTAALSREIQGHVKARLAAYEYPRRVVFARELPMTVSGKIRRSALRAPGADERYGLPDET